MWLDGICRVEQKVGRRTGTAVRDQCCPWPSHLTLFVLKNLHLSSLYILHSSTTNDLGLTDDDTKTLTVIGNFLNESSKALARTPNSNSSARQREIWLSSMPPSFQCLRMAVNGECMQHARVRKESLVFPYPHRETAEHRGGSKVHDRPDGDVLSLGQYHTVGAGEDTRPARVVEPRRAPLHQLHTPRLIKVLSLFLCHHGTLLHGRCHRQTSR